MHDKPEKILIVRLSAIGDVVHALPCLAALRKHFPQAYIAWVCEDFVSDLLRDHPQLDEVFVIPKKRWRRPSFRVISKEMIPFFRTLRKKRFDVAFDFQGLTKSSMISFLAGAKTRVGFDGPDGREISRVLNNRKVLPGPDDVHVVEKNFSLLREVGIIGKIPDAVIPIQPEDVEYIDDYMNRANPDNHPLAGLQITAGWETKELPHKTYIGLALKLEKERGLRSIFTWGPGEEELVERIADEVKDGGGTPLVAPPTKLRQLASLISRCRVMIGGDTGPMQMVGPLDVPSVAIFGGSDGQRNCPYTKRGIVIQKTELECVPCWKTKCPKKGEDRLKALNMITVDEIVAAVDEVLKMT
jgi:lipopolysaccharide heptosyltransferase I